MSRGTGGSRPAGKSLRVSRCRREPREGTLSSHASLMRTLSNQALLPVPTGGAPRQLSASCASRLAPSSLPARRPIGVDLFAGAGGMSLGFEQSGFDVLTAVELDPVHCATYEFNIPFSSVLCASVAEITGVELRRNSPIGDADVDVVFGGPPCQGFSHIGRRSLDDPRNTLIRHFMRLVVELQPKYFVMENVRGLTIGQHRRLLLELIDAFKDAGYQVL